MRERAAGHLLFLTCLAIDANARGVTFALYRYDDCEQDRASWIFKPNATQLGRAGACVTQDTLNELGLLPSTIRSIQLVDLDPACTITVYTGICNGDGANALRLGQCMNFSGFAFSSLSIDGGNCNLPEDAEAGPFGSSVSPLSTTIITGAPSTTQTAAANTDTAITASKSIKLPSIASEPAPETSASTDESTTGGGLEDASVITREANTLPESGTKSNNFIAAYVLAPLALICSILGCGYVLYTRRRRKQQRRNAATDNSKQHNGNAIHNGNIRNNYWARRSSNHSLIEICSQSTK